MRRQRRNRTGHWTLSLLGLVIALVGLVLAGGGAWLAALGGSWYYVLAGAGMLIAGAQLMRGRMSGAVWYALVFVGTVGWSAWESGLDYWRWVPRLGLIVAFAFVLALLLPRLQQRPAHGLSRGLALLLGLVFVAAFALAFLPHGVTPASGAAPNRVCSS